MIGLKIKIIIKNMIGMFSTVIGHMKSTDTFLVFQKINVPSLKME